MPIPAPYNFTKTAERVAHTWFRARLVKGKYGHIDFKPPAAVAKSAERGLEYRRKQKGDKAGLSTDEAAAQGIGSGVQRAVNLKNRDTMSPSTVRRMHGFFNRHQKNKAISAKHKGAPWRDRGYVAWLLWGGDPGRSWATKLVKQMEAADRKKESSSPSSKCMEDGCKKAPERECLWADGRGRAWFCEPHFKAWEKEDDGEGRSKDIVKQRKVPDGVVGDKYGQYPKTAKATGPKTRDGESVGLFIPLPKNLAEKFPDLGENDHSPSHVTFLYIGEFKGKERQENLLEVLRDTMRKWWPGAKAKLNGLEYFDHPDKDRRVPHVSVDFDKDLSGFKHRVKQELFDAGVEVGDSFPEFKPHVTLAYLPGMGSEWEGPVPEGEWEFDEMEVWGLPELHKIKLGPQPKKVAASWLRRVASRAVESTVQRKNVALMKWLSALTRRLGVGRDTYVVGGAVRNFLIDKPIKDIDIVIDTTKAGRDSDWLAKQIAKNVPAPTNVTTNQYGVAILTVKGDWLIGGDNMKGEVLEIANARKESYGGAGGKGYKPHAVAPATIDEDVLRREFTFNTLLWRMLDLAQGPAKAEIIDLTGCGRRDLDQGVVRCPQEPDKVFSDDPTRMLRAIKFTGRYGFKIPPDVKASIKRNVSKLKRMPWEAVASILVNDVMNQPTARRSLKQMKELGLLDVVSEMIQEQKPFATYMSNQLRRNRKVQFLLDLLDLGVPASTPISFLDRAGQQRLRDLTVSMPEKEATFLVEKLIKPPVDNRRIIDVLSLPGPERRRIVPTARHLILQDPELSSKGKHLTDRVIEELRR